ncbi:DMT family transporter [Nonomuraea soli]|uniref:Drug/metabolite transporter (DMT)-like permease n=1 Tax=Nonomuraea soli TaxID=1032476 RepID=A0A7W0CHD7_9ACTN|nr:EamA family transporter [Nonomuraea soli]MBA2891223.1 drug/metabolite transporter (DMT)-like permease [Nonomuraea soli]
MSIGILLALAAAVGYGAADFVGGFGSRRAGAWPVVFVGQIAGAALMLGMALAQPGRPQANDFAWALLAGAGTSIGTIFLYRGLARGRMGLVAPVSAVGAALLPVGVEVALGGRPSILVWLGVLVALPGIWLVSGEARGGTEGRSRAGLVDGAVAGAGFGVLFVALGQVPETAGTFPLAANQVVGALVTVIVASALRERWLPRRSALGWGIAAGCLGALGTLAFMIASQNSPLALAAVLASLYPAVTVTLAALVLAEHLRSAQRVGLVTCLAATALLALG